jgi:high-affinity iron transporter
MSQRSALSAPRRLALALYTGLLAISWSTGAVLANEPEKVRLVVHLLDYIAKDYEGAVSDGKIKNKGEYQEQLEFLKMAREASVSIGGLRDSDIENQLERLDTFIKNKEDSAVVSRLAREIQSKVVSITHLDVAPTKWPNLALGKQIFDSTCIACHGATGHGDGIAGKNLDPRPSNFHDAELMKNISPFQAFNTIRLGVPGTGMASFDTLSDAEVWDLAFYVVSFRYQNEAGIPLPSAVSTTELLKDAATHSDEQLGEKYPEETKKEIIAAIRTHSGGDGPGRTLLTASNQLEAAQRSYDLGDYGSAKTHALRAYLEGIEPLESRLRASDAQTVITTEEIMSAVRQAIDAREPSWAVRSRVDVALLQIQKIEQFLQKEEMSPWLAFTGAFAIFLREGFEAILIIVTLLGIIYASGTKRAAVWVHAGWVSALLLGAAAWVFSGWLIQLSGAGREVLEGVAAIFAVVTLLVVGFWLHSQTEIGRWHAFIQTKIKSSLQSKNLFALALMSFIAVFREAFETVLFLRAIWIEGASDSRLALGLGAGSALVLIFALAFVMLKFSARIPVRKLFVLSSSLMAVLALILTGKGFHALQESGAIPVTSVPINLRVDLIGLYPTYETVISQVAVVGLIVFLWSIGRRSAPTASG